MGHYKGYSEADFENLLQVCATLKGKFMLSSYPSELLAKYTEKHGWKTIEIKKTLCVGVGKDKGSKTEVLTLNYDINNKDLFNAS